MNTKIFLIAAAAFGIAGLCFAQTSGPKTSPGGSPGATNVGTDNVPFTEGTVWEITMVKTKPGMDDDYLRSLNQTLKPIYEEEKSKKIILDYKILLGDSSSLHDYNILIMVQYPNMAAFDGLRAKTEPIVSKGFGGEDQRRQMAVKRLDIREILGAKTMREITLK